MRYFWVFCFLLSIIQLQAQEIYTLGKSPEVEIDGKIISSPFAGGINAAQIQLIDLTADGKEEWVVWDINTRQLTIFKEEGGTFTHLPEMSYLFPADISGFLILEDYDGDGKKDLFTATALGIKVYKNTSSGNQVSWSLAQSFLKLDQSGNIQVNNLDRPLLKDVDGDGDLDLITFNFAAGDYLEFYKNTSVERTGKADIDGFAFPQVYWGNFVFCDCAEFSFGQSCEGKPLNRVIPIPENKKTEHAGGHAILYEDFNGDGISDLILGRDECSTLYYLENKGTESEPIFTNFSTQLPQFGALPEFPIFHIAQKMEEELLISLNSNESAFNYNIDFASSIVKLDKNGNMESGFLQNQMIDLGENTRITFQGNKQSGELLLVANAISDTNVRSEITRFSFTSENSTLIERDYLNLSSLKLVDAQILTPLSQTSKSLTLISGIQYEGTLPVQVLYQYENGAYTPYHLNGYEPKRGDYLQIFTYRNDQYLLVAAQNGSLSLYQIDLTQATATLLEQEFLGFSDNPSNRNLNVAVYQKEKPDLYAVDQQGKIVKIEDFMEKAIREEILVRIGSQNQSTRLGRRTWIALIPPVFDGSPDLLLGTGAGGLIYLKSTASDSSTEDFILQIFPNPSLGPIKIITNKDSKVTMINALGQSLLSGITVPKNLATELQTGFLPPGIYFLRFEVDGKFMETRKVWIR